jgi:hypothetical protein
MSATVVGRATVGGTVLVEVDGAVVVGGTVLDVVVED